MKNNKKYIYQIIKEYLIYQCKKKKIKINFNLEKVDFIQKEIIDSLSFLSLISLVEKKIKKEIDLSNENPNKLTKLKSLSQIISKK